MPPLQVAAPPPMGRTTEVRQIMKLMTMTAALALSMAVGSLARADGHPADFVIHNDTGVAIESLFVSQADSNKWGGDILGVDTLAAGEKAKISFSGDAEVCVFDIRITHGTDAWVVGDVDLCKVNDMKFTKKGDKVFYTKE